MSAESKAGSASFWNAQVEDRVKGLRKLWLDDADKTVAKYEQEDRSTENAVFNILYSNTETLLPALYNSTPRPDVTRRYTTSSLERRLDSAVAQATERLLEYSADSYTTDYETFDVAVRSAVLHALVPGQGQTRVRMVQEGGHQEIVFDTLSYDRFIWSYARKWCEVTWVAFGYDLNQEGFEDQFPEFCRTREYKKWAVGGWKGLKDKFDQDPTQLPRNWETGQRMQPALIVWEIWNHEKKEIKFICDAFKDSFLKQEGYPFDMVNRFPCPSPLKFVKRNSNLTPKAPYALYADQDKELQEVSRRFLRVVKAIRARGAYDARLREMEQIFSQDSDNALVPIEQAASLGDGTDLSKGIWMVPIDTLVEVAGKLAEAREQIKQTIYEITGVGDILRGQGESDETAAAASIKNSWGTLRLKRMQADVSYFCRDLFRIAFEFMANCYTPATIKDITKLEYLMAAEKKAYQVAMGRFQAQQQQAQAAFQQVAQQAQAAGQPPPPPPPQSPPPVPQDKLDQMSFPVWEEICQVMQDRFERTYRIDIETNSTIDLEATEDKQSMSEFMNAFGQMAAGLQSMAEVGILPYEVTKQIIGELLRRYRFGRRVEQMLEMAQPPQGMGGQMGALQGQMAAQAQQFQAQLAGAKSETQGVREQLERERADRAKKEAEYMGDLKERDIQITTLRSTNQLDKKIGEHSMAQTQVQHATEKQGMQQQVAGVQRQVEMERLNGKQAALGHAQELGARDRQIADMASASAFQQNSHKGELAARDLQHKGELGARDTELGKRDLELGALRQQAKASPQKGQPRA